MEKLKARYEEYVAKALQIRKNANPLDGIFGLGNAPQNHPDHVTFYEDVQHWVAKFCSKDPSPAEVFEVVRFVLCAPAEMGQEDSYWMMFAAHGIVRELISRLGAQECAWLRDFYDANYPKKTRMPVQDDVYKRLKKRSRGK